MRIFFCGDIMTGRGVDQILQHPSHPNIYETYIKDARDYVFLAEEVKGSIPRNVSSEYIWGAALDIWKEKAPHLKVGNLETAVTLSETYAVDKGINYRMQPQNISVLKAANFDICSLANNHVLDWGVKGLEDTISVLDHNRILQFSMDVEILLMITRGSKAMNLLEKTSH